MTLRAVTNLQACDFHSKATKQLVLLRHAAPDGRGRFCGHSNPGLSEQGRAQVPAIIQGLSLASIAPKTIWSSDLRRAVETAYPIAEHLGLNLVTSPGLREMYFGSWEGLTWQEVEARFPEDAKAWAESFPHHRPPKGESYSELQTRAILELESLLRTAESECSLVVTHAGLIRAFIGWVLGIADQRITSLAQDYGSISVIKQVGDHWSVAALNLNPSLFAHINKDRNNCL